MNADDLKTAGLFVMAFLLGAVMFVAAYAVNDNMSLTVQLKGERKASREAWGKVYDMQDAGCAVPGRK